MNRFTHSLVSSLSLMALLAASAAAATPSQTARILGGLPVDEEVPTAVPERELRDFTTAMERWWTTYEERLGGPTTTWALATLEQTDGTIFYPFAGADFGTVHRLYPSATRYVLMALEPGGRMPDLARSADDTRAVFSVFNAMMEEYHRRGYFITSEMGEQFSRGLTPLEGITPVLAMTAEREGYEVTNVEPIRVADDGSGLVLHEGERDSRGTWRSVRLSLTRRSDGVPVVLEYLRLNLGNDSLEDNPNEAAFVTAMSHFPVLVKAASYLLQYGSFSVVRDAILANAPSVVQDDSGFDYTVLSRVFEVRIFGEFVHPHEEFSQDLQQSLVRAYVEGDAEHLPSFRFGYWKDGLWCLQYAHTRR